MIEVPDFLNASILIVDDQEANVLLLKQLLHEVGYRHVTSTMDSQEVCALHMEHHYDLILLDLRMPKMDGFQVLESLKEVEPHSYLPVLVITAQPELKLRALKAGAKDFISKPFDLVEVQTRIHNLLEVRLLYKKLADYNKVLEHTVHECTAELQVSELRFERYTELSSEGYWEQNIQGEFTKVLGKVFDTLGVGAKGFGTDVMLGKSSPVLSGWTTAKGEQLNYTIENRRSIIDFIYSRKNSNGTSQYLQVSGEPMFDSAGCFVGYRGTGKDITDCMPTYQE